MAPQAISRRSLLAASLMTAAVARPARASRQLDFSSPEDNLTAWMKLHTSLEPARLYYWYRCRIDSAMPNRPITRIVGYDSVYLYEVQPNDDGTFEVVRWETAIYTDPRTNQPVDECVNPLNGQSVRPFHIKEGPTIYHYSRQRPRIVNLPTSYSRDTPFVMPWTVAGDDVWVPNETYVDFPHPLPKEEWPKASSGDRIYFSNISTLRGSLTDLENQDVVSAPCRLSYQATATWLPWLQMGQTPGFMVIQGQGRKFTDVVDIPGPSRLAFERYHPEIFTEKPWAGHKELFTDYAATRES